MIPDFYQTHIREIPIGDRCFAVHTFADFEKTVDQVVSRLQAEGAHDLVAEDCPYFGELWQSAIHLAHLVNEIAQPQTSFLEVGCGLALPSLVAAAKGAAVEAIDLHRDVAAFLMANAQLNGLSKVAVHFQQSAWRDFQPQKPPDYFIASDVLYEEQHVAEFVALAHRVAFKKEGILIDPCRWYHQAIIRELERSGFRVNHRYLMMDGAKLCEIRFHLTNNVGSPRN